MIRYQIEHYHTDHAFKVLEFEIEGGVTSPQEVVDSLSDLPDLSGPHLLILSGRGPVWLFAMLLHLGHAAQAVAVNDPRLGWVVVQSHHPAFKLGRVIDAQLALAGGGIL